MFCFRFSHSTFHDVNFWRLQWGNNLWTSHGSEHSAGIYTFQNNFSGSILHNDSDPTDHFLFVIIELNLQTPKIILLNFYGYNLKSENKALLDCVEDTLLAR